MRRLLLATALLALLPVTAQAADIYQWPGIWLKANPPGTYSTVIVSTAGQHCRTSVVTVGFDNTTPSRVYSCRENKGSQSWTYMVEMDTAGPHTIQVAAAGQSSSHDFGVPAQ
jgi:opacity protein-like surface antigen